MWINEFYSQQRELPCLGPHNSGVESSGWLLWIHMLKHMISRHNDFLPMDGVITTPISTCSSYTQRRNCGWTNKHGTGRIRSRIWSLSRRLVFRFHFHFYEILMDQQRALLCSGHIMGLDASFTTSVFRKHGQARIRIEWTKYGWTHLSESYLSFKTFII